MSSTPGTVRRVLRLVLMAGAGAAVGAWWASRHRSPTPPPRDLHEFFQRLDAGGMPPAALASVVIWLAFSAYWSWAARGASRAASSETKGSRAVHLVIISAGQVLVLLPVTGLTGRLWPPSTP